MNNTQKNGYPLPTGISFSFLELACAIVKSKGIVSEKDKEDFSDIIKELKNLQNISSDVLDKECMDVKIAFLWSIYEIKNHFFYFKNEIQQNYVTILKNVLNAFPDISPKARGTAQMFFDQVASEKILSTYLIS